MGLFSKKEFGAMVGMNTRALSVYIKRKKVVVGDNDMIDDKHHVNADFLIRRKDDISQPDVQDAKESLQTNSAEEALPTPVPDKRKAPKPGKAGKKGKPKPPAPRGPAKTPAQTRQAESLYQLEKEYKETGIEKTKAESELLAMKRDRLKGLVIPTDIVRMLFVQHSKAIVVGFEQGVEKLMLEIAKKARLGRNDMAELRGKLIKIINTSVDTAVETSKKNVKNLVEEYSSARATE